MQYFGKGSKKKHPIKQDITNTSRPTNRPLIASKQPRLNVKSLQQSYFEQIEITQNKS